jgi:hypothetical protein
MTRINKIARRTAVAIAVAGGVITLTIQPAIAVPNDAALARQGTAAYHDASVITQNSDWFQLFDVQNISCIDNPAGGMGIHFVNGARVGDPTENAAAPEAVIYEPTKNGGLRLVAVEYVVTKQAWEDAGNTAAPRLYNRDFELVLAGNRYGLPDFYELHAWLWKHNPSGFNEDWNPNVTCAYAP